MRYCIEVVDSNVEIDIDYDISKNENLLKFSTFQSSTNKIIFRITYFKRRIDLISSDLKICTENHSLKRISDGRFSSLIDPKQKRVFLLTLPEYIEKAIRTTIGYYFQMITPLDKGAFFHAAAIEKEDSAYLFLGESNAGKTTVSKLARKCGFKVLSDEKIFIYYDKDYTCCSTPFGDLTDGDLKGKLKGVFFLNKHLENKFISIKAVNAMTRAWSDTHYRTQITTKDQRKFIFNQWFDMFASLPCYEMRFTRDFDQWDKLIDLCEKQ